MHRHRTSRCTVPEMINQWVRVILLCTYSVPAAVLNLEDITQLSFHLNVRYKYCNVVSTDHRTGTCTGITL
jgi:hypothetical protein